MNKSPDRKSNKQRSTKASKADTGRHRSDAVQKSSAVSRGPAATDEVRSLEGWRGRSIKLEFGSAELDLLDNVLCIIPELRVVARLGQEARRRGLQYPVRSAKELAGLLRRDPLEVDGHRVNVKSINDAIAEEWFPLAHEGELLSVIHLAIRRCETEAAAGFLEEIKARQRDSEPSGRRTVKK